MEVEDAEETVRQRNMPTGSGSEATALPPSNSRDAGDKAGDSAKIPVLAWNTVLNLLADAEPATAGGVAGVLVILVLTVFGRLGSLIVGILGGLLLHASFEKKRGGNDIPWTQRFTSDQSSEEKIPPREVCHL
jgi:hypothetical protein